MTRTVPAAALLLVAACAATPDEPEVEDRADARALHIKTTVKARLVRVVLAARWKDELKLEAIHKESPRAGVVVASGSAVLDLRNLHAEASESIEVRFIEAPDHEDLLLDARKVSVFRQDVEFGHRTENADLVTMANEQVSIFP